ncbi:hypothetical protein DES42_104262 [Zavarzinia compransoris]|nr:hypothetical protein [Zavarzinia compransoris]TDP46176.1 hypothetical protein DES42_104262 [Zavarzinia compransoris]
MKATAPPPTAAIQATAVPRPPAGTLPLSPLARLARILAGAQP